MSATATSAKIEKSKRQPKKRREAIFTALRQCIIDQGYATTTLADIAHAADMTPSHLLYYFSDKADILSQYFGNVSLAITSRLAEFENEPPIKRIDFLAKLFFSGKGLSKSEIGFMLECFGVAVHAPDIKQQKTELDRICKEYLRALFKDAGAKASYSTYAAEVSYALLVGLRTAVYFDEELNLKKAYEIFRGEMMKLVESLPANERKLKNSGANAAT
ncbi:TetR/AcrR family transcriptional regulator [Hyphococcus sp.]|uniref:TetR/AcrR family transcriptional regulator n=1 Tax=Hyphococcus sp. TaxID=2038636 RepID=UPI003CCC3308